MNHPEYRKSSVSYNRFLPPLPRSGGGAGEGQLRARANFAFTLFMLKSLIRGAEQTHSAYLGWDVPERLK